MLLVAAATAIWIVTFACLAILRHLAGGSHAEDLGFSDQVLWNFLNGQCFRMSLYHGARWNTELDLSLLARADSLLAFHVEPMLLVFVPLYALGAGPLVLLAAQSIGFGLGAVPAFRLGAHAGRSALAGLSVALAYLLSPFGQSAVLSDFHTSTLAVPFLLLSLERMLVAGRPSQSLVAVGIALTAREDVGPVVAFIGMSLIALQAPRRPALLMVALGLSWTLVCALIIGHYSGGVSPLVVRYAGALGRPLDVGLFSTLLLTGGWLAAVSPLSLLGALPTLAIDALSSSPWMAAGKAHYGVLLLPAVVLAAAVGLGRLGRWRALGAVGVLLTATLAYLTEGAGPLAANYAPATVTQHTLAAQQLAESLPSDAAVSASTSLVPRLSHRSRLYLFPNVLDADYVFLDVRSTSAPTSPGDVFLRVRDLLGGGGWRLESQTDGLLLLQRDADAPAQALAWRADADATRPSNNAAVQLLGAELVPSPDGAIDVDGPRWILHTTWRTDQQLPSGTHLDFWITLHGGEQLHVWDVADMWWNPPDNWLPGARVTIDVPDVPVRRFESWRAQFSSP